MMMEKRMNSGWTCRVPVNSRNAGVSFDHKTGNIMRNVNYDNVTDENAHMLTVMQFSSRKLRPSGMATVSEIFLVIK